MCVCDGEFVCVTIHVWVSVSVCEIMIMCVRDGEFVCVTMHVRACVYACKLFVQRYSSMWGLPQLVAH